MTTTIGSSLTRIIHTVRVTDQATQQAIAEVRLAPRAWPPGWSVRVVDGAAIVWARSDAPPSRVETLDLILTDGLLRDALSLPVLQEGQPADSIRFTLPAVDHTADPVVASDQVVELQPAPRVLTVVLTKAGAGATPVVPSIGRTVLARPSAGADVPLPETATPGTYRSAAVVWGATLTPADLRVGSSPASASTVRKVCVDPLRADTRIDVVDSA